MVDKTNIVWNAYRVYYSPSCEPEATIGYFQNYNDAQSAYTEYAEKNGLKENGICCGNIKNLIIEKIEIL